jgi:hypothetical protein
MAIASPMPVLAPVTIATLSFKRPEAIFEVIHVITI